MLRFHLLTELLLLLEPTDLPLLHEVSTVLQFGFETIESRIDEDESVVLSDKYAIAVGEGSRKELAVASRVVLVTTQEKARVVTIDEGAVTKRY